ncbi:MAG: ABC transporter substrate-binding protein, partial [Alphaproteobacteria bacterium]|nr:ABC transporter substrate-binding protein [Alphaproteobacteria bacterium]
LRPQGDVAAGAALAIEESQTVGNVIRIDFELESYRGADVADLVAKAKEWRDQRAVHFVIVDLPGSDVEAFAAATASEDIVVFNATAPDDRLRGEACRRHVFHAAASNAMQADAMIQYLISRKWSRLLVLQGPLPEDTLVANALAKSAARFGAKIVETKPFLLSNDPRRRDQNNVALMTAGGRDHDVVFVVDTDGEFGRYVPYQVNRPRPVVGTTGLVSTGWHWSFERHGAPQLNSRFERATGRRMVGQDWATWVSVKAIVQAVVRARSVEFEAVRDKLTDERLRIDGFKGPALTFRTWNHQLRQPILLATQNAVLDRAPIEGFLHQTNTLDTLGDDQPDSNCRF